MRISQITIESKRIGPIVSIYKSLLVTKYSYVAEDSYQTRRKAVEDYGQGSELSFCN
jgi:hypothetical protein